MRLHPLPSLSNLIELKASLGPDAKSQNYQDAFVLSVLGQLRGGYFVEVGAANGVQFSNTYLLEKRLGWTGILVEPATAWHQHILANRTARLDPRCAWSTSGSKVTFCQFLDANLSTTEKYVKNQERVWSKSPCSQYEVETATLTDILRDSPPVIDYLSIDVEGAEIEVLAPYDFSHQFKIITCEHNFDVVRRAKIHEHLASRGYLRVCESISKYDDWYVLPDPASRLP